MSRFEKEENENPNPAERFLQWNADREHGGKLEYYDRGAQKNINVELPFTFWVLDKVAQVTGGTKGPDGKFMGYWSNAVKNTTKQPFTVRSKAGIVVQGLYEDLKIREDIKYQLGLYIGYRDENGEMRLGFIKFKGSSLGAWFEFTKEYRDIYQGGFAITGSEKKKNGATVYYAPKFAYVDESSTELLDELMAIYKPLKAYLDAYFKNGASLPETNEDGDELTHTGPAERDTSGDADFYRDNAHEPKPPVLTPELTLLCNELNKYHGPTDQWTAETLNDHVQSEFDKPLNQLDEDEMEVLLNDMQTTLDERRGIADEEKPEPEPANFKRASKSKIGTIRRLLNIKGYQGSEPDFLKQAKIEGIKSFDELNEGQADALIAGFTAK